MVMMPALVITTKAPIATDTPSGFGVFEPFIFLNLCFLDIFLTISV
ncbi:hypothetical protein NUACC26_026990 [Scytonema sp. NUACC26]